MLSLKKVMRINASSCLAFGSLFVLLPTQVAAFLGGTSPVPSIYILVLGIILMINGLHLLWASWLFTPPKMLITYFSIGDFLWAVASVVLMALGIGVTTVAGVLVTSAIAVVVGGLGVLQIKTRKLAA